jgi:phage repressor protein C with HTH and peptisase S24 domain
MGYFMTSGERLRLFREKTGYNQSQFAKFLNIPARNWSRYETNLTNPPPDVLVELAKLGLDLHWHLTGEGEMFKEGYEVKNNLLSGIASSREKVVFHPKNLLQSEKTGDTIEGTSKKRESSDSTGGETGKETMTALLETTETVVPRMTGEIPLIYAGDERLKKGIIIPFLEDQPVSAGPGTELDEGDNPTRYMRVPGYLARYQDLAMLPVRGDSMDPTLHDGDMVVCDSGGWDGDGIYVIKSTEKAFVKRVVFTPEGYQIISDNKMYPSYGANDENLKIVGKVRAAMIAVPGRRGGI